MAITDSFNTTVNGLPGNDGELHDDLTMFMSSSLLFRFGSDGELRRYEPIGVISASWDTADVDFESVLPAGIDIQPAVQHNHHDHFSRVRREST